MNSIAKIGSGITVASGIGTGGYFVISSTLSSEEPQETKVINANTHFTHLTANSFGEEGLIGKIYYKYLVDSTSNQEVGNGLHERYKEDLQKPSEQQPKDKFSGATVTTGAFSSENVQTTLNKACDGVYKEKINDNNNSDATIFIGDGSGKGLGRYCSVYDPKLLEASNENGNTIQDKAKGQLLSADNEDNKELGEAKDSDFFSLTTDPESQYFKALYDTKSTNNRGKLKDKCQSAYSEQSNPTEENKPKLEDVLKYCSMKVIV